jgi:hypothetical protein
MRAIYVSCTLETFHRFLHPPRVVCRVVSCRLSCLVVCRVVDLNWVVQNSLRFSASTFFTTLQTNNVRIHEVKSGTLAPIANNEF